MKQKLVIFGTSNFAEWAHYAFTNDSDYEVVAFSVDTAYLEEPTFLELPVVAFEEVETRFPPSEFHMFIAVGIQRVNQQRADKMAESEAKGYRLASHVGSRVSVESDFVVEPNVFITDHSILCFNVEIGRGTILAGPARIAPKVQIGEYCWLATPILGELAIVGDYSFLGLNSTIAPSVSIGKCNVIGAGALILRNSEDSAVYKGAESKPSRVPSHRLLRI